MRAPLPSLLLALLSISATLGSARVLDVTVDLTAVLDTLSTTSFEYIVVGGGNAGLAVAARISQSSPSRKVLVLEAGQSGAGNPGIDIPGLAGTTLGKAVDWSFFTTPQEQADTRSIFWPRGKVLGGSSAINFLVSTRPNAAEQDVWASLAGSSAWSWQNLLPFYKKAEHFFAPGTNTENEVPTFTASTHGTTGPIDVSYPPYLAPSFRGFFQSLRALGVPAAQDLHSGNNIGVNYAPSTIDPSDRTRSYSVEYLEVAPSLVIVTGVQVTKINFAGAKDTAENVVARSVTFVPVGGGQKVVANASREVILSAGTVQTPQLLELSGIGDPAILNLLGISTLVNLPGVGANLQDHPAVVDVFRLKPGVPSLDQLQDPVALAAALADYAQGRGILTEALFPLAYLRLGDFLNATELAQVETLGSQANNPQLSAQQYGASQTLWSKNVPVMELLSVNVYFGNGEAEPNQGYVSLAACLQHSLSRGSIHITSSDPLAPPAIDPNYLQSQLDTFLLAKAGQYLRRVAAQSPLADFIESEAEPGPAVQSEQQWEDWTRSVVRTEYHPIGTASMTARANRGVVAPNLKVYGTANVRVVDMSVVPVHVSSHTQTVAYAIAEKAASLILSGA
ncbi:GMC family oxidoreductase [Rhodotorula paludigena]|uniref:GMC family oxidoreductase n=1 Tax=Rhodotorula paludigena TaxID=86838 RepID=UPI00316B901F